MSPTVSSVEQAVEDSFFVSWFEEHGRSFPWRSEELTPFQMMLTEMLLRRTQAAQVEQLWHNFMSKFGTPDDVVNSQKQEILQSVGELGFGSQRTKALQQAAAYILNEYDGEVPQQRELLTSVPHIGPYSTQAIRCFAFGQAVPVVDTNVLRLFCRLTGRQIRRPDVRRVDWAWEEARSLLPEDGREPRKHNYGLLDFTAQVCSPRSPNCENCPLSDQCAYGQAVVGGEDPTAPW